MKTQELLDIVGPEVLEMMRAGDVDKETALGFFNMLKPHPESRTIGNLLSSKVPPEKRREMLKSRYDKSSRGYNKQQEDDTTKVLIVC